MRTASVVLGISALVAGCGERALPPAIEAEKVLHLEADRGMSLTDFNELRLWQDQSGAAHDARSGSVPARLAPDALAGIPVLRFSGAALPARGETQRLELAGTFERFSAGLTAFALIRVHVQATSATLGAELRLPQLSSLTTQGDCPTIGVSPDLEKSGLRLSYEAGRLPGSDAVEAVVPAVSDEWLLMAVQQTASGEVTLMVNAESVGRGMVAPAGVHFGCSATILGGALPADVALLLLFKKALDSREMAVVEASIRAKWQYR